MFAIPEPGGVVESNEQKLQELLEMAGYFGDMWSLLSTTPSVTHSPLGPQSASVEHGAVQCPPGQPSAGVRQTFPRAQSAERVQGLPGMSIPGGGGGGGGGLLLLMGGRKS